MSQAIESGENLPPPLYKLNKKGTGPKKGVAVLRSVGLDMTPDPNYVPKPTREMHVANLAELRHPDIVEGKIAIVAALTEVFDRHVSWSGGRQAIGYRQGPDAPWVWATADHQDQPFARPERRYNALQFDETIAAIHLGPLATEATLGTAFTDDYGNETFSPVDSYLKTVADDSWQVAESYPEVPILRPQTAAGSEA